MGACTGAPCMQVNYDFHENLDADKVDALLEQLQEGKKPAPVAVTSGARARAPAGGSSGDQQALRHAQFEKDRHVSANRGLSRRSKKRSSR